MPATNNKWNQWRQKELRLGKNDDHQIAYVHEYLKITHDIIPEYIKKDWYILFDFDTYDTVKVCQDVLNSDVNGPRKVVIRHPDIIILNSLNKVVGIIEIDGSYHHSNQGRKQTVQRNNDYKYANIPLIIINIADLRALNISWAQYLDDNLEKFDLTKSKKPIKQN